MNRLGIYRGVVALGALLVLVPLLVWGLALQRTVSDYRQCLGIRRQIEALRAETPLRDSLPEVLVEKPGEEGWLLRRVLALATGQGGTAEKYTPRVTRREGTLTVMTHEFVFGGAYIPLLRTVEGIERELPGCKIVSLTFRLIPARRADQTPQLKMTLLLQEITEHDG